MFVALWFIFFNSGPTAWMKNDFYIFPHLANMTGSLADSNDSD